MPVARVKAVCYNYRQVKKFLHSLPGLTGLAALLITGAVRVDAADCVWGGGTNGSWSAAANWQGGVVPGAGDTAIFWSDVVVSGTKGKSVNVLRVQRCATVEFTGDLPTAGKYLGPGAIKVSSLPGATALQKFKSADWKGTLVLKGLTLEDFNPDDYGNASSAVGLEGCKGYFPSSLASVAARLDLVSGETASFAITQINPGQELTLAALSGDGTLKSANVSALDDDCVIGVTDFSDFAGTIDFRNGDIVLVADNYCTINRGKSWHAASGALKVVKGSALSAAGTIDLPVEGDGEVYFMGPLGADRIEKKAQFTATLWRGGVVVKDALLDGPNFSYGVNSRSVLVFDGALGTLGTQSIESTVVLTNCGLNVTGTVDGGDVRFNVLSGVGDFLLTAVGESGYEAFTVKDASLFRGKVEVDSDSLALVFGDGEVTLAGGTVAFNGQAAVSPGIKWRTRRVYFGEAVNVANCSAGDVFMAIIDSPLNPGNYRDAVLNLLDESADTGINYGLYYDEVTGYLGIVAIATPPSMNVQLHVDYGVDVTNVTFKLSVEDYEPGLDYTGGTWAQLIVYDGDGKFVKAYSANITGNGDIELGTLVIDGGFLSEYRYDLDVLTKRSSYDAEDEIDGEDLVDTISVLSRRGWLCENAESFVLPQDDARRTGSWECNEATVALSDDGKYIKIENDIVGTESADDGTPLKRTAAFAAKKESTEEIVKVTVRMSPSQGENAAVAGDSFGYLQAGAESYGDMLVFEVYDPSVSNKVEVTGPEVCWLDGEYHDYQFVCNYTKKHCYYMVDNTLLKTASGQYLFAIDEKILAARSRFRKVGFSGCVSIEYLDADEYSGFVADAISADGSETNRFSTLDEAIASMSGKPGRIVLNWDATWHPSVSDNDSTYTFDTNGHDLVIDVEATNALFQAGYQLVDNGDDSYSVKVIDYNITLAENDLDEGDTEIVLQKFSATNMVFNLKAVADCFVRPGYNFLGWNERRDGKGIVTWQDQALVDMNELGLADRTLYAQWEPVDRSIRVEASDDDVYIELVTTNDSVHTGVRYFKPGDTPDANYQALIPVKNGCSNLVIRFSTDLGKRLSFDFFKKPGVVLGDEEITAYNLPTNVLDGAAVDSVMTWAASRYISKTLLSQSAYSRASSALSMDELITEDSEVVISCFELTETGCRFRVTIDGSPIGDPTPLKDMVKYSTDLVNWSSASDITVDAEGNVEVSTSEPGAFIKIVIPKN